MVLVLLVASLGLIACVPKPAAPASSSEPPAKVAQIAGSSVKSVKLTRKASERLGVQMVPVRDAQVSGAHLKAVPYAALIYDVRGDTWAYTSPEPLLFVRQQLKVDHIQGDQVLVSVGPAVGTTVVTVGTAELYGAELGVGK
jgi:hypothetical protein